MKEIYEQLAKIAGPEHDSDQPEERYIYSMDPGTMSPREPDYVVMPNTTEEVRQIMLLANRHEIPVVPLGAVPLRSPTPTAKVLTAFRLTPVNSWKSICHGIHSAAAISFGLPG